MDEQQQQQKEARGLTPQKDNVVIDDVSKHS
jgi:hypothetical protein